MQAIGSSLLPALRGALGGGGGGGLQGPLAISSTAGKIAEREPALLPEFAALLSVRCPETAPEIESLSRPFSGPRSLPVGHPRRLGG